MRLVLLSSISQPMPISELSEEQLIELQVALGRLGYPVGDFDGLIGPKTRNAWAEFKIDVLEGNPALIGPESINSLCNKLDVIDNSEVDDFSTTEGTIQAIIRECKAQDIGLSTQIAYVLATVEWESAKTFKPVREAFWKDEEWRKNHLRYYPYYGRGYAQITWKYNYEKYAKLLGIDLVKDPDLAMKNDIALFILVHGFKVGAFTGRKITDYINNNQTDFIAARRCINGRDHAADIAELAESFLRIL